MEAIAHGASHMIHSADQRGDERERVRKMGREGLLFCVWIIVEFNEPSSLHDVLIFSARRRPIEHGR